jgi:hypothetical protein
MATRRADVVSKGDEGVERWRHHVKSWLEELSSWFDAARLHRRQR